MGECQNALRVKFGHWLEHSLASWEDSRRHRVGPENQGIGLVQMQGQSKVRARVKVKVRVIN